MFSFLKILRTYLMKEPIFRKLENYERTSSQVLCNNFPPIFILFLFIIFVILHPLQPLKSHGAAVLRTIFQ